MLELAKDCTHC
jgi:alcohol-forming fatty acyl-CoA reductase